MKVLSFVSKYTIAFFIIAGIVITIFMYSYGKMVIFIRRHLNQLKILL